jgi:hypothetical protein
MRPSHLSIALSVSLAAAALVAACGSPPAPEVPPTPPASSAMPDKPADPMPAATTPPASTGDKMPDKPPTDASAAGGEMPTFAPSKMGDMLKEAGFDINNLKPMKAMKGAEKAKLMKSFAKSTGQECKDCHVEGDFKKSTPKMQIAKHMWDEYVVPFKAAAGGPVYCDSCHQGKAEFLSKDKEAVKKWMEANMVKPIERKDKKDHNCQTCHGELFEMHIVEKIWKIKK